MALNPKPSARLRVLSKRRNKPIVGHATSGSGKAGLRDRAQANLERTAILTGRLGDWTEIGPNDAQKSVRRRARRRTARQLGL